MLRIGRRAFGDLQMIDSNPKYANKQYYQGQKSKWVTP